MSQVRKLQKGGSLTIDGIKYDATPEFINSLTSHIASTAGTDAQTLAGLTNALQNGRDIIYNSASNTITGMDGLWGGITERQDRRRDAGSSSWRKWLEAQFDTDAHRFRNALTAIGSFNYQAPKKEEETPTNLRDISSDKQWFEFTKGEDGKEKWNDSVFNSSLFQRIDDITSWLKDPEAGKKAYRLGSGYTDAYMQAFQNLYNQDKDNWDTRIQQLKDRLRAGNYGDQDLAFLKNFFIAKPDATAEETAEAEEAVNKKKWTDAGVGGLYDRFGKISHLNDDGSITLNDGQSWGWNLGDLYNINPNWNGNLYFNDDFYRKYGADKSWEPLRGYTAYGNTLYSLSNPTLRNILEQENGFNALKDAGDWEGADNIIMTRFTDAARENPGMFADNRYAAALSDHPEYRFTNLTGLYNLPGLKPGEQLIQRYNLDKPIVSDSPYREYSPEYIVLNNSGEELRNYGTFDGTKIRGAKARDLNAYNRVTSDMGGNRAYHGRYYEDIVGKNGEATGYRVYYDPNDPENIILHMPGINANGVDSDQDIKVPADLGRILAKKFKDETFLKKLIGNSQNKKDFQMLMSQLVQSWFRKSANNAGRWALIGIFAESNRKKWKDLGFKDEELNEILNAWRSAKREGNREDRQFNYLVTAPEIPEEKNGGVIEKHQFGGVAGGSTNVKPNTARSVDAKNTNPKNAAAAIGDSKNWTDADTADMVALVADLGSLGLAIAPGMGIAAAGTGAAGSTARLYADLSRGTKGAGLNYLVNLGMDATTLIPFLGAGVKGANIAKNVAKALPTIIKAASVYGLGAGVVETAKKIASGEKFTVRDVDMLVNAITAGVGLGKSGGLGRSTKKGTKVTEGVSLKNKAGDKTIELSGQELEGVNTPEKLFDKFVKKSGLSQEAFSEQYDVSSLLAEKKTWKPGWNPKTWFTKETQKVFNPSTKKTGRTEFTPEEIAQMSPFERWHRGLNTGNQLYNARIRNEGVGNAPAKKGYIEKTNPRKAYTKEYLLVDENGRPIFNEGEFKRTGYYEQPYSGSDDSGFMILPRGVRYMDAATGTMKVTPKQGVRFNRSAYNRANAKYNNRLSYYNRLSIAVPQPILPLKLLGYEDQQPSGFIMPEYKQGGKIEKAQLGLNTSKLNIPTFDINKGLGTSIKDKTLDKVGSLYTSPTGKTPTFVPSTLKTLDSSVANFKVTNPMTGQQVASNASTVQEGSRDIFTPDKSKIEGQYSEQKWIPDPTMPLNVLSAAIQLGNAGRQRDIGLQGGPLQYTYTWNSTPRYIDLISDAYKQQADKSRVLKANTSNVLDNALLQKQGDLEARQFELQDALAHSNQFGQYIARVDENYANNIRNADQIANQNRYLEDNWLQQKKNTLLGYETQKSQILDKLLYAGTQYASNQVNAAKSAIESKNILDDTRKFGKERIDNLTKVNESDPNAAQKIAAINDDYVYKMRNANILSNAKSIINSPYLYKLIQSSKKGGKLSEGKDSKVTYSRDPYPELLIQNSKDSAEAVKQLNDAVIKLLLQTKPINVH